MIKLRRRGFTLVEIMLVTAIMALMALTAIPNLLRARHNANEAAAINSLTTIRFAMESYRFTQTPSSFLGASLPALANMTPPYIDERLGSGRKQGYGFLLFIFGANRYFCLATPLKQRVTGTRQFLYTNFNFGAWQSGNIYAWDPDNPGWRPVGS